MAQNFFQQGAPVETGLVREYVANTQTNTDTLRSNFSGSSFPSSPVVGQHCFRVDDGIEYIFDGKGWIEAPQASNFVAELLNARGSMNSLEDRLNVAINEDGTLKNPIAAEIDEWKDTAIDVTYVNDNQFSVEGDLTPIFTKGRSVKVYNRNGGEITVGGVTTVVSSAVSGETTIVTVANSIITSDLYDVKYGLIQESILPQRNSLQRSTVYEVGDIAYTDRLKSNMYLSCVQPGTTGVTEPSYKIIVTPSSVGEAVNVTLISDNGGTTGTVTSGGTVTGASDETIFVKLSTSTPDTVEPYDTVTLSYCVGSQEGEYTEIGLADGEPQEVVDGVTVQLSTTGVFEDGETYSISCVAEVAHEADVGDKISDGTVTWTICKEIGTSNVPLIAGYNQKQTFTSSGSFVAPITGLYKITLQGGGGSGGNGVGLNGIYGPRGAGGGGAGAKIVTYEKLTAGTSYSFTIGAGGTTPAGGGVDGINGGDSSITVNDNAYVAGGGGAGHGGSGAGAGGSGGVGTKNNVMISRGASGCNGTTAFSSDYVKCVTIGGPGGGDGGSVQNTPGVNGGGGGGGRFYQSIASDARIDVGSVGGDGYVTFEWLDTSIL